MALLLLQPWSARREARAVALAELRPENLMLAAPRGCLAARPQRLLLADFGRGPPRPPSRPRAAAGQPTPRAAWPGRNLGHVPGRGPAAPGGPAGPRAALGGRDSRRGAALGARAELRGRGAPLGSWLRMRRALLVLHLAERAVGGEVPSLEDWLCCEYLAKGTEDSLYLALELLCN